VRKGKRAISPLIATIILISICVAGGLLVYSVFMSTTSTLTAKGQVEVESIDLVKDTDGNVAFSITVKNSGNKPINSLSVTVGEDSLGDILGGATLQPGQSASKISSLTSDSYTVGNSYNVVIQVSFTDGSSFAHTTSVRCRSG